MFLEGSNWHGWKSRQQEVFFQRDRAQDWKALAPVYGAGIAKQVRRWTGYLFVVRQSLCCMFRTLACALKDKDVNIGPVSRKWLHRWFQTLNLSFTFYISVLTLGTHRLIVWLTSVNWMGVIRRNSVISGFTFCLFVDIHDWTEAKYDCKLFSATAESPEARGHIQLAINNIEMVSDSMSQDHATLWRGQEGKKQNLKADP